MLVRYPDTDNSLWDYQGRDNFLVIPITKYIRKDGAVTFVHPLAKEAEVKFPKLANKWGWMIKYGGVLAPTHRTRNVNIIGLPDREHYASQADPECIEASLLLLNELSWGNPGYLFYLDGYLGGDKFTELNKRVLTSEGVVVLLSHNPNEDVIDSVVKGAVGDDEHYSSMS